MNGHDLYWERYGSRQAGTITLLHHGLGSIRSWRRQTTALTAAGWEVLVYDRWGYGRSDPRPDFAERYLLEEAREAFHLLDQLDIQRTVLIGHSEGGTIALLMASMQPERIPSLVVVAAHIYYEEKMKEGLVSIATQAQEPSFIETLQKEHGERTKSLVDRWVNHWLNSDPAGLDMSHRLEQITCPALVIQGELDEHATPGHAKDIAEGVAQGELWLIPATGHMPTHEIPDQFNQRVLDFLARQRV